MADVLFVCTGNQCRSPMAEALLEAEMVGRPEALTVASAGFVSEGAPSPEEVFEVMQDLGIRMDAHRSQLVTPDLIRQSRIVVGMTRQHLIDLTVLAPAGWERCFTFAEVVRRAESSGGRQAGETMTQWVGRVHGGRSRSAILGMPLAEDVPDPLGGRMRDYEVSRDMLAALTKRFADLALPA